jgi:heme iron utilization protein
MDEETLQLLANLVTHQRTASLGTLHNEAPFVSMILISPSPDFQTFDFHISTLAAHTRDLLNEPRCSLLICETDQPERDPQTLARLTLFGSARQMHQDSPNYPAARDRYLARFPQSAQLFTFKDFSLFRFQPEGTRFVAGFARAFNLSNAQLEQAARLTGNH